MRSHKSYLNQAKALHAYFLMIEKNSTTSYESKCKLLHRLFAIHKRVGQYNRALEFLDKLDTLYSTYDSQSHKHLHTLGLIASIDSKVQNEIKNKKHNKEQTKEKQKQARHNNQKKLIQPL
jgi:hypothetical protein